ncbi:LLM class flavin-dependent oxidoreductase [Planococcus ruber]|uniref:LLM class flavin-dependent oxidoreductase n=1 Tax=Planococcus ruber TaxID=2027871 RepID=UPI001FED6625|nr:LLM class flavin-dependent oxidoreductase [Planococcus ruber]MCJ1909857.1 LLM class flavin-dependent oxidoreductase [Planococcus ruber]
MLALNLLDYSPIDEGKTARQALLETTELVQLAERSGYKRFWVAEHHKVASVAGSSPEMLMMHLAASTSSIRIGSGGVMLPHYSAYKVAENFRMLEALHPNRIDLGIGRSRSYQAVNKALNSMRERAVPYEEQLALLKQYFADEDALPAMPIIDTVPEMWLLGTGEGSAVLAAEKGMAYSYAHFARPSIDGMDIIRKYRSAFKASPFLEKPKVMIAVFAVVAETKEQAEEIAKAFDLWLLFVESNTPPPYYPSIETAKLRGFSANESEKVRANRKRMVIGDPDFVKAEIERIADRYGADEVTIIPNVAGAENRMEGIRLLAEAFGLAHP